MLTMQPSCGYDGRGKRCQGQGETVGETVSGTCEEMCFENGGVGISRDIR